MEDIRRQWVKGSDSIKEGLSNEMIHICKYTSVLLITKVGKTIESLLKNWRGINRNSIITN